jgi:hypothetical protein
MIHAGLIQPDNEIARVGIGAALQKGAVKPDLSNRAALRSFLLNVKRIAGAALADGSVGSWVLRSFQRMGTPTQCSQNTTRIG